MSEERFKCHAGVYRGDGEVGNHLYLKFHNHEEGDECNGVEVEDVLEVLKDYLYKTKKEIPPYQFAKLDAAWEAFKAACGPQVVPEEEHVTVGEHVREVCGEGGFIPSKKEPKKEEPTSNGDVVVDFNKEEE